MRCPKCHYLSFEPEPRCRNCGYDFVLAEADLDGDLGIRPADAVEMPLADFDLHLRRAGSGGAAAVAAVALAEPPAAPMAPPVPRAVPARAPTTTTELPLFVRGLPPPELPSEDLAFDGPLVLVPHAPRPPLAVRRRSLEPAPVPPPPSSASQAGGNRTVSPFSALVSAKSGGAEHGRLLDIPQSEPVWAPLPAEPQQPPATELRRTPPRDRVGPRQRVTAALVDAALLAVIDAGIVWFTLRICALTIGQAATLPLLPLAAFCALLDVGYLLMFTATSGQTVGKMAAGIRVIGLSPDSTERGYVTIRQAAVRALLTLPSLLVAGAGFLPALFGRGPAVHDRIAHTRVVRS